MAPRGPYGKGEAKRREILRVALEIFAVEGYRGTSLRKVAAECGLTLPGLMHYFTSKEDLLTQVLRAREEAARAAVPEHLRPGDQRLLTDAAASTPGLVELFVSLAAAGSDPEHPAHAFFTEHYGRLREGLARMLAQGIAAGRITDKVPPERQAALLVAVVDGMQMQWLNDRTVDMGQALDDLLTLMGWDGVGEPGSTA